MTDDRRLQFRDGFLGNLACLFHQLRDRAVVGDEGSADAGRRGHPDRLVRDVSGVQLRSNEAAWISTEEGGEQGASSYGGGDAGEVGHFAGGGNVQLAGTVHAANPEASKQERALHGGRAADAENHAAPTRVM